MKELIKNALILCGITVVAGLLLGAVYEITKEARSEQQEKAKINAYKEVLEDADDFEEMDVDTDIIKNLLEEQGITEQNVIVDLCVKGLNDKDEAVGYIVSVTSKEGYGGNISFSVGFSLEGKVTGVSILSIGETAGLGMNAKEESFLNQYRQDGEGLYVVNKDNSADGINIDSISGATITTNAMTKGVNAAKITAGYLLTIKEEVASEGETTVSDENGNVTDETTVQEGGESVE